MAFPYCALRGSAPVQIGEPAGIEPEAGCGPGGGRSPICDAYSCVPHVFDKRFESNVDIDPVD
jgi:hypothetical protein